MTHPTSFEDINSLLHDLLRDVQSILGDNLVGFYLDGSLALGDFDPDHSDIDFLVASAETLPEPVISSLADMHRQYTTSGRPYGAELEGAYIPVLALRRYDPQRAIHPNIERGPDEALKLKFHHSDWVIHRHIMREYGLALAGPPSASLIDPVSEDELRAATMDVVRSWWLSPEAAETIRQGHSGYLAYVVQTMCRALFTWENGTVVSKPVACGWALDFLGAEWRTLIESAAGWKIEGNPIDETQRFIQNLSERFNLRITLKPTFRTRVPSSAGDQHSGDKSFRHNSATNHQIER